MTKESAPYIYGLLFIIFVLAVINLGHAMGWV